MSLTHYWRRVPELPAEPFRLAVNDLRFVLGRVAVEVGGPNGTGLPMLTDERIGFNGKTPAICEPFEVHRRDTTSRVRDGLVRSFCKTGNAPYDLCVRIALIVLQHHLGNEIEIGSDDREKGWDQARQVSQEQLGYGVDFRMSVR